MTGLASHLATAVAWVIPVVVVIVVAENVMSGLSDLAVLLTGAVMGLWHRRRQVAHARREVAEARAAAREYEAIAAETTFQRSNAPSAAVLDVLDRIDRQNVA